MPLKTTSQSSTAEGQPSETNNMKAITAPISKGKLSSGVSKRPAARPKAKPKPRPAPLPAIVDVRGYEITIPNVKMCWRVSILHDCGHPVMEDAPGGVRYPGCNKPLVAEISRHSLRACTNKCKIENMEHVLGWNCNICRQMKGEEPEQGEMVYHGLPLA